MAEIKEGLGTLEIDGKDVEVYYYKAVCGIHKGIYQGIKLPVLKGSDTDTWLTIRTCPLCKKQAEENERKEKERSEKQEKERAAKASAYVFDLRFDESGIPKKFKTKNIVPSYWADNIAKVAKEPIGRNLVLDGSVGTGKTTFAIYQAFRVFKNYGHAIFINGLALNGRSMKSFDINKFFEQFYNKDLIIIDELGKTKNPDVLEAIISIGYDQDSTFLFTMNEYTDGNVTEMFSQAAKSRLKEKGILRLRFEGVDLREHKPDRLL